MAKHRELRVLHYGMKGADVKAAQRALRKALLAHKITPVNRTSGFFGEGTVKDNLRFERLVKLPNPNGEIDAATWARLMPYVDRYGKWLLGRAPKPLSRTEKARGRVVHHLHVLLACAPTRYRQVRPYPMSVAAFKARGNDCSGSGILAWKLANDASIAAGDGIIPDPNGTAYNGTGWTGSLEARGRWVAEHAIKGSEGSFYTRGHVIWSLGDGSFFSNGRDGGPYRVTAAMGGVRYRGDYSGTRDYLPPS